jgi:O-antigen ligase
MFERLSLSNSQLAALARRLEGPIALVGTLALGSLLGIALTSSAQDTAIALAIMLLFTLLLAAHPRLGLLTWLVLYPFVGGRIDLELGVGLPDLSVTRYCVAFLTAMLVLQIGTRQRPMFRITKVDLAAFAFFLALAASNLAADNPIWAFQFTLDRYFIPLMVYFIARNLMETRQDVERLISALLILASYSAVYLIYQHTLSSGRAIEYSYGVRIVTGLLGGPHVFGLVFTMSLPFAVQRYLSAREPVARGLYLALSGLLLAGVFFTYKRGIWLAAVLSFLVIQFLAPRFRRFFLVLLVLVALVLAFAGNQLSDSAAAQRFNDDLETGNGRTYMWEAAIELWKKSPISGHGFGRFSALSSFEVTENFYLNILVSAGLVGLLPFLALLVFVARHSARIYSRSRHGANGSLFVSWEIIAAFAGAAAAYLVKAFSGNMASPLPNIIFFLLIGAIVESQVSHLSNGVQSRGNGGIEL